MCVSFCALITDITRKIAAAITEIKVCVCVYDSSTKAGKAGGVPLLLGWFHQLCNTNKLLQSSWPT